MIKKLFSKYRLAIWGISIYDAKGPFHITNKRDKKNPVLTYKDVTDCDAQFIADPFMIKYEDLWYMFFEIYDEARQILENNHTVVISGQPGMGKSTIARVLAMDFLSVEYYEGLYWVNSLDEIEDQWEDSCDKQVFIMDDYWGAVFHRERGRRENSHLEDLIC